MRLPRELRWRLALLFAGFGAALSLMMAVAIYEGAHDLGQRLIDETLSAELDDYIARRERNPASLPPSTVVLQGYVGNGGNGGDVPPFIADLSPGRHDVRIGAIRYRAAVLLHGATRFYLLYDTSLQLRREHRFAWMLGLMVALMTLVSALGGIWMSRRVVAPVAQLAARVRERGPNDWDRPLGDEFPGGEVGELARMFDRHLIRMRAFMERERAFGSDVGHELRTTLAIILSTTEILLEDTNLSEGQRRRVRRIETAARDMSELGAALLLMAREEHPVGSPGACVVADVVQQTVDEQRYLLAGKPVEVRVTTAPGLVLPVDAGLVRILVANLVRNAFSYTATGRVDIVQDTRSLTVSDTGKGMPPGAVEQAFVRPFHDSGSEGAGIGLPLVKRICDRYGWTVKLESGASAGTRVTVEFS